MKLENGSTEQAAERQRASSPMSGSGHTRASDAHTGSRFEADAPTATARKKTPQPMRWNANGDVTQDWLEWSDRQWLNPAIARD